MRLYKEARRGYIKYSEDAGGNRYVANIPVDPTISGDGVALYLSNKESHRYLVEAAVFDGILKHMGFGSRHLPCAAYHVEIIDVTNEEIRNLHVERTKVSAQLREINNKLFVAERRDKEKKGD